MVLAPEAACSHTQGKVWSVVSSGVYCDYAATEPIRQVALEAWAEHAHLLNPGGQYLLGRRARQVLEESREQIAATLGCEPIEVIFTASGTESDNLALAGLLQAPPGQQPSRTRVISSAMEHPAVTQPLAQLVAGGVVKQCELPLDGPFADVAALAASRVITAESVVTLMLANNETGAIQPVPDVAQLCAAAGAPLHVDAVQAVGHIPVNFHALGATTLAASAHKFGGPRGMGLLLARRSPALQPLLHGGGQERGLRPGTVNVAGAAATAASLSEAVAQMEQDAARIAALRDKLRAAVAQIPDTTIHTPQRALPGHLHVSFRGTDGDSLMLLCDMANIACSTGSACASGVNQESPVLRAMGADEPDLRGALRLSIGRNTTQEQIAYVIDRLPGIVAGARKVHH